MKRILTVIIISLLLFACNSQTGETDGQNDKPVVTVSILPQKTFVEKIGGDDFEVNVLVPSGASPATYSLSPSQLKNIASSEIWFRIGYIGFESAWAENIQESNEDMTVIDLSEGLDLVAAEEVGHDDHEHAEGVDPHIWLSPGLVKQMAEKIRDGLIEINPEKASEYAESYTNFVQEIDQLHEEISLLLQPHKGKKFLVFHPSLAYFARDYGLEQYPIELEGKEPTPQHMAEVIDLAEEENLKVIYIQDEFDRDHAEVIAEEIDGTTVQFKPLDPNWAENLREITQLLIDNFE